jgi:phosphatidylserine decarboxylase
MSTAIDYVQQNSTFSLRYTEQFTRQRRKQVVDPYDPDSSTLGDWTDTDDLQVNGALASLTSTEQDDAVRSEVLSTAQFVSDIPDLDVRRGDRLLASDGRKWNVVGYPTRDMNAFTGWQPTLVAALQEVVG